MLERLLYQSTASRDHGSLALFNLLTQAQQRNERLQVTGHLLYVDGQFTQCLEGPADSLDQIWSSIQHDDRHHNVQLILRRPTQQRRFTAWSMAFSSYAAFYVHGMKGFFPIAGSEESPLVPLCGQRN